MEYYLKIAEMKVGLENDILKTILGSCVGLCFWDKEKHIGGMVHIMLPDKFKSEKITNTGKYAVTAVPALLDLMLQKGCSAQNIIAKIFGGASMFQKAVDSDIPIGEKNYSTVSKLLKNLHIPVAAEDLGGTLGRSITFFCSTGLVKIKTSQGIIEK